jgi:hypothetical protein
MRCERCQGSGYCPYTTDLHGSLFLCPDCCGSGIAYCCDEAGANPPNTMVVCPICGGDYVLCRHIYIPQLDPLDQSVFYAP